MGKKNKKLKHVGSGESSQDNPFQEGDLICPAPEYDDVIAAGNIKGSTYTKDQKDWLVQKERERKALENIYGRKASTKRDKVHVRKCSRKLLPAVQNLELFDLAPRKKKLHADRESSAGSSPKQPAARPKMASDSDSETSDSDSDWDAPKGRKKKMMGKDMEEQGQGKVPSEELGEASTRAEQHEEAELSQQMQNKRVPSPTRSESCCSSRKRLRTDTQ
ncbi:uncharacterized protein LOC134774858 [Penaeus indicus]|uniref:uncharacterized protein LOC134774858 n=1 Tax=Penaeus indicus TaxID=29960 RepID=UPI00300C96BA